MPRTPTPRRRAAVALRGGALAALSLALAGGARAARTPCNASQHAAQQFAQWDSDGDGLVSKSEAEAYVARTVLGLPSLAPFPQFRYEVRAHHESLDSSTPLGLDAAEFAQAAWVRCGSTCMCGEDDDTDAAHAHAAGATLPLTPKPARAAVGRGGRLNLGGAGARRSLGAAAAAAEAAEGGEGTVDAPPNENGDDVPGATVVPGLWSSIASLQGDGLYAVRQMTLFNSNQLRCVHYPLLPTFTHVHPRAARVHPGVPGWPRGRERGQGGGGAAAGCVTGARAWDRRAHAAAGLGAGWGGGGGGGGGGGQGEGVGAGRSALTPAMPRGTRKLVHAALPGGRLPLSRGQRHPPPLPPSAPAAAAVGARPRPARAEPCPPCPACAEPCPPPARAEPCAPCPAVRPSCRRPRPPAAPLRHPPRAGRWSRRGSSPPSSPPWATRLASQPTRCRP